MKLTYKSSANLISYYLRELRITQNQLAKKLNVTQSAVSMAINKYRETPGDYELRKKIVDLIINSKMIKKAV